MFVIYSFSSHSIYVISQRGSLQKQNLQLNISTQEKIKTPPLPEFQTEYMYKVDNLKQTQSLSKKKLVLNFSRVVHFYCCLSFRNMARIRPLFATVVVVNPNGHKYFSHHCVVFRVPTIVVFMLPILSTIKCIILKKKKQHKMICCSPFHQIQLINGCFVCKKFCAYNVLF